MNKKDREFKTSELKNFINDLKEMDRSVSEDIKSDRISNKKKNSKKDIIVTEDKVTNNVDLEDYEEKYDEVIDKVEKVIDEVEEVSDEVEDEEDESFNTKSIHKIEEKKTTDSKNTNSINNKPDFYLSFGVRTTMNIIALVIVVFAFLYSLFMSFAITKEELIKYRVSGNLDYKVYLKPNEFYDTPYLDKGMVYVSSLIDKINVDYNYKFDISKQSDIDFNHKLIARIVIASKNNSNIFFEKEYDLSKTIKEEMINNKVHTINEQTSVNYSYYNDLANKFRSKYAVDTNSYLEVYLQVEGKNRESNSFEFNDNSKTILTIPLSQQEINISLEDKDVNENNQILSSSKLIIKNKGYILMSALFLLIMVFVIIDLVKRVALLTKKKSNYDNYINKILKGYDRVIVNVKTIPNFKNYNNIKVESFQELLDVRDNFKCPINYYVITEHLKSEFFVINNNDLYVYVVKAIDLEGSNKK